MFGTKIRSWMEAHLARSRTKRKEKPKQQQAGQHPTQQETLAALDASAAFFVGTRHDFNEILPALALSPSHHYVKVHQQQLLHHHHHHPDDVRRFRHPPPRQHPPPPPPPPHHQQVKSSDQSGQQQQRTSAVNLSSPESAYSTGYSTDGTSPCATYAPEYYINVRPQQQQQQQTRIDRTLVVRGRREDDTRIDHHTGTYTVRNRLLDAETQQQQQQQQQQHNPWRKPAPPTAGRPIATSPKIQNGGGGGYLARNKPYSTSADCDTGIASSTGASYPLQLFSPRRMPMVATTTTQVMPLVKSPRQRSRVRTNPWPSNAAAAAAATAGGGGGNRMMGATRPWSRQHMYNGGNADYCCRQESLSVGRSPVNRSDWRSLRQQQQQQQLRQLQQRGGKGRTTSSSASSCSSRSRSRSCSVSSTASSSASNAHSNASSPSSSDDITLNEVMGKYDDNYLYEKETDIVSDHEGVERRTATTTTGGGRDTSCCSSANFSSDASASSLDLQHDSGGSSSRSTSRQRLRVLSGRRQRRRRHRRSVDSRDDEAEREHREEVELLQEVINRRFKKNNTEASAQTNRALLERLLMKNASSGSGGVGYEGRRAWSANPAPMRGLAASRSVGGTPICLRRTKTTTRASHLLSPQSRLVFERNHQVYPAESTSSLKNMSASELALIEADKEADLKYAQLIMEAERMLLNVQQQLEREESACSSRRGSSTSVTADSSLSTATTTSRRLYPQQSSAPNKRVELIKNAELNIELALSKSRNSQPELSSGSIKDLLDHSSPKRLLQQQQKKIIEPAVFQAVASTQTTANTPTSFHSLDVAPTTMVRKAPVGACADDDDDDDEIGVVEESLLPSTSEHYACPQSEPVKRKVYEAQEPGRLLQRQQPPWLRNSDGDCASEQQLLQTQLQSASAASSYSQLRKHMLIETLQGLKQSLEDQSAALKMSCLRPL